MLRLSSSLNQDRALCLRLVNKGFRSRVEVDPYNALQNGDLRSTNPCNWNGALYVGEMELIAEVEPYKLQIIHDVHNAQRHLSQDERNLPAAQVSSAPPLVVIQSHGSGSFAAIPSSNGIGNREISQANNSSIPVQVCMFEKQDEKSAGESWVKWIYAMALIATASILIVSMMLFVICKRHATMIGPCKTELSSQLQRAFITGIPKLNRTELEVACEDFSNIIITLPNCTVFKGILLSGVEISVVSTKATS